MAILTNGRRAIWDAILSASDLRDTNGRSVFHKKFKFDEEEPFISQEDIENDLAFAGLPAIAIWTTQVSMAWNRNTDQEWIATLNVMFWVKNHHLPDAEKWAEALIVAIHEQTAEGKTVSYVKESTGHHPMGAGDFSFVPVLIGGERTIKATRTSFNTRLRFWKSINPTGS